jgi:20S proteasome alpha/beta subunit
MPNKVSFSKKFGKGDFEKIMNEIILQKISYYAYEDRHISPESFSKKFTKVIHQSTRGE